MSGHHPATFSWLHLLGLPRIPRKCASATYRIEQRSADTADALRLLPSPPMPCGCSRHHRCRRRAEGTAAAQAGPAPAARRRAGEVETGCSERQRFELELEFLHCLANPGYLNCEAPCWLLLGCRLRGCRPAWWPAATGSPAGMAGLPCWMDGLASRRGAELPRHSHTRSSRAVPSSESCCCCWCVCVCVFDAPQGWPRTDTLRTKPFCGICSTCSTGSCRSTPSLSCELLLLACALLRMRYTWPTHPVTHQPLLARPPAPRSYPHSLYFLDLLQTPEFRAKIASPAYKELVHTQQVGSRRGGGRGGSRGPHQGSSWRTGSRWP